MLKRGSTAHSFLLNLSRNGVLRLIDRIDLHAGIMRFYSEKFPCHSFRKRCRVTYKYLYGEFVVEGLNTRTPSGSPIYKLGEEIFGREKYHKWIPILNCINKKLIEPQNCICKLDCDIITGIQFARLLCQIADAKLHMQTQSGKDSFEAELKRIEKRYWKAMRWKYIDWIVSKKRPAKVVNLYESQFWRYIEIQEKKWRNIVLRSKQA